MRDITQHQDIANHIMIVSQLDAGNLFGNSSRREFESIAGDLMARAAALRSIPAEIPFELSDPLSADSVRPGPSYFIVPIRSPANSNATPRKRTIGDPDTGAIRVASMFGHVGKLIDAYIQARRPTWASFYTYDEEAFYSHLCVTGADIVFLHASYRDLFQRLKLDPAFCDVPVVLIDSWHNNWRTEEVEERYVRSGAAAALFLPVMEPSLFKVIEALLPEARPDPSSEE